jgi:hypothetical protein
MTVVRPTDSPGGNNLGAAPALTIEPDEFLGLRAVAELENAADEGAAGAISTARTLMHTALAARLDELGLPWAPSPEAVRKRATEAAAPDAARHPSASSGRARIFAVSALAVAALTVLWGGYIRGWQWTGFRANDQLWNWLKLLLLPVVVGTIPLWIQQGKHINRAWRVTFGLAVVAFTGFVAAGYLIPLKWTGFPGTTLWSWWGLILLPVAVTTLMAWPSAGRSLGAHHKAGIALLVTGWVITVIVGYALRWSWTGYQGNTLWDWLKLLLLPLIIPTILLPAMTTWISRTAAQRAR